MNRNFFTTAFRILKKNKTNTFINVVGLGLGFSISFLLMIYVVHQLSYDRFHEKSDRIFRVTVEGTMGDGKVISGAMSSGETADLVIAQVPEAEHVTRLYTFGGGTVVVDEQRFTSERLAYADSAFFRIFTFPFIAGDPETAFRDPMSVVLSVSTAEKFFGTTDVLNEVVGIRGYDYRITGVMKDMPRNSHLKYDILAAFESLLRPEWSIIENNGISFPTYILMRADADPQAFREKVLRVADERILERFQPIGIRLHHNLQPIHDVYLHSQFSFADEEGGDIRNVYIFSFLAFFILLIAVFNYVNLITAQSEKRTREIGMRKVIGANKQDLVKQFIGESVIVSLIAFVLALLMNELLITPFSHLVDEKFSLIYWQNPWILGGIVLFVLLTGVVSGIYPAFYLSRHEPIVVLKGTQHGAGGKHALRKILVSLQFAISIFLIASLLLVHRQVNYMKHKDLGFDREHVITVTNLTRAITNSYESLKAELLQNPNIISVAASESIPGQQRSAQNCYKRGDDPSTAILVHENRIQHDYLETFGIRLIEGRDFDPEMRTDSTGFIINQATARKLGLDNPIGEEITVWTMPGRIIGVVADFNFFSLHHEIEPLVLTAYADWFSRISIRMQPGSLEESMDFIRSRFEAADPNYTFDYTFVDQNFERMYQQEDRINKLITAAAILAVVISFMGLFALTSFTVARKVKEIGIRKTLGAPVHRIVLMLSGELSRWMLAGNIIAWPATYLVVSRWQQNFAFQIDLVQHWWLFLTAGLLAGAVGILAMLYQSLSAARANPVESLRSE
ncbi:MAG: FtsX-like permease family protein [Bacteroidales bacterium]